MPADREWLVVRDVNLIRYPQGKNKEGGDVTEMLLFMACLMQELIAS